MARMWLNLAVSRAPSLSMAVKLRDEVAAENDACADRRGGTVGRGVEAQVNPRRPWAIARERERVFLQRLAHRFHPIGDPEAWA